MSHRTVGEHRRAHLRRGRHSPAALHRPQQALTRSTRGCSLLADRRTGTPGHNRPARRCPCAGITRIRYLGLPPASQPFTVPITGVSSGRKRRSSSPARLAGHLQPFGHVSGTAGPKVRGARALGPCPEKACRCDEPEDPAIPPSTVGSSTPD